MANDNTLSYDDLVQLALFPDGSSLSSRLQKATVFRALRNVDANTHDKAVRFASLVNQEVIRSLDSRLQNWKAVSKARLSAAPSITDATAATSLTGGKGPKRPLDASNFSCPQAEEVWGHQIQEQLKRLLKGVNLLAGFKGALTLTATGIVPLDPQLNEKDQYTLLLWIEDAVGFQQDLPVEAAVQPDGKDVQLMQVNSEDSFLRVQVFHHRVKKLSVKGKSTCVLLGEVRVPVLALSQEADVDLKLPVFTQSSSTAYTQVPIYDLRSPTDPPQGFTTVVELDLTVSMQTNKPTTAHFHAAKIADSATLDKSPAKASPAARLRNLRSGGLQYRELSVGNLNLGGPKDGQNASVLTENQNGQQQTGAVRPSNPICRERWAFAINMVRTHNRLRVKGRELREAIARSKVLQEEENTVEQRFRNLMDQVFAMWEEQLRQGVPQHHAPRLAQSDTIVKRGLQGCLVPDDQPLYYILKLYDEQLYDAMQNLDLVGKYLPDMTFFHPLFVYASMAGVRPLLFKAELVFKLLGRWDTANEALLRFVQATMDALKDADSLEKLLLTKYEKKLFTGMKQHLQPKLKKTLVQHYDKLEPTDAAGRTVLLEIVSQFMPAFNKTAALGKEVLMLAQNRYRATLEKCNEDKVDHMLRTLSVADSETVQNTAMALAEVWEQAARDFEADLSLEAQTKDIVQVRNVVMEQYTQLKNTTQLLIEKAPSWPYSLYGFDAMSMIESSIITVNKVLEKYDVATAKSLKEKNANLKLNVAGASELQTVSSRIGDLERYSYTVVVYTSKLKGAGTDSGVYLNIIGNAGSSGKLVLNEDKLLPNQQRTGMFEKGAKTEFRIQTTTFLGVLQEVEIGIDGKGEGHSWHLDRLEVMDDANSQKWFFECNAWLSRTKGDMKLERKLTGSKDPPSQRKVRYTVKVQTSDIRGAGTDAYVHLQLKGSITSYETYLDTKFKNNFERGSLDTFSIGCTELGNIDSIVVTLSNTLGHHSGDDWHLQDIRIINEKTKVDWLFLCNQWFNKDKLVHELTPLDEGDLAEYRINVYTSDKSKSSTDARVYIILDGEDASSGLLRLKDSSKDTFERGAKDEFTIRCRDLGKLKSMRLGHDGSSGKKIALNADLWNVAKVEVIDVPRSHEYFFPCDFWVGKSSLTVSAKLEHEVKATAPKNVQVRRKLAYIVVFYTSDITHASSNAKRVFVELIGSKDNNVNRSSSGRQILETPKNGFQRGASDSFRVECTDVGYLQEIVIGQSGSSFGDSWHVDRVEVHTEGRPTAVFPCQNWLSSSRGDKKTERRLPRSTNTTNAATMAAAAAAQVPVVVNNTNTTFTLLDWPTLLWAPVTAQVHTITRQFPPIIDRQLSEIRTWTAVSQRLPYAVELKPVIEATTDLINACLIQVIIVIAHSSLRAQVAVRVLTDAVQPIVQKVAAFIKNECIRVLLAVQPRGGEAPITIFDDEGQGQGMLELIYIRVNSMVQYYKVVEETLMSYVDETTNRITPEDTARVRRVGRRTQQRIAQQSFQVVSALHKAMRFGFLVILHDCLKEVPEQELITVLPDYLFSKLEQMRKFVPRERIRDSCNSAWSSLLEAVKRVVLGLSRWDLMHPFKLSMDQHRLLEGCLKTLEIQMMHELGGMWEPKESLLLVEEKSHVRLLLETGAQSTAELQNTFLEECLEQERILAARDAKINLPYQGTEVVIEQDDLMELQQNQLGLDVLDYVRLLRSRDDGRAVAQARVEDLHKRGRMQVLFGLPIMTERQLFTAPCKRCSTSKLAPSEIRTAGHLYVFTNFLCYTTLLVSGPDAMQMSDITNILRRGEDTKQPEKYDKTQIWITLSDESELKLEFQSQADRDNCFKVLDVLV